MATTAIPTPSEVPPAPPAADPEKDRLAQSLARAEDENRKLRDRLATPPTPTPRTVMPDRPALDKKALEDQLWKDPLPMIDQIARVAAAQALDSNDATAGDTLIEVAKNAAREKVLRRPGITPELIDRYILEVENFVKTNAPTAYQKNINVWENGFNNILGQHLSDVVRSHTTEAPRAPAVITSRSADGAAPPSPPSSRIPSAASKLTEEQKEMAHTLAPHVGWSHDEAEARYAHGLALHESPRGRKGSDPSPFDPVITSDNRFGKRNAEVKGGK